MHKFSLFKTLASAEDDDTNHDDGGDNDDAAFRDTLQHASWLKDG